MKQLDLDKSKADQELDVTNVDAKSFDTKFNDVTWKGSKKNKFEFLFTFMTWLSYFGDKITSFFRRYNLAAYALKRLLYGLITLVISIILIFIIFRSITPDTTYLYDVDLAKFNIHYGSPEYERVLEAKKKMYGVDGSIWYQTLNYLKNVTPFIKKTINLPGPLTIDPDTLEPIITTEKYVTWIYLGQIISPAYGTGHMVSDEFARAIPKSFEIGAISTISMYFIAIPIGILAAKYKGKAVDNTSNFVSIFIQNVPSLIIISMFMYVAVYFFGSSTDYASGQFSTRFWPILTNICLLAPYTILDMRRYMVNEMNADYTNFAISKGMSSRYIFYVHVFRNAGILIISGIPTAIVSTIFGSNLYIELMWKINGMSRFVNAANSNPKDIFVMMGFLVVTTSFGIVSNLVSDLLIAILDPRVALTKK